MEPVSTVTSLLTSVFTALVDPDEIIVGLKSVIGVIFSKDETRELSNYMDEDKSGDIDEHEFC